MADHIKREMRHFRNPQHQRVFRCDYICEECTRAGSEWTDILLTAGPSWCPCCDREVEPDSVEEFEEECVGWEDDDETDEVEDVA